MTSSYAVVGGAAIIAVAVIMSRLMAPYAISAGTGADSSPVAWRVNAITGDVQMCSFRKAAIRTGSVACASRLEAVTDDWAPPSR